MNSNLTSHQYVLLPLVNSYPSMGFQRPLGFRRNERCHRAGAGRAIAAVGQRQEATTACRGTHLHSTADQTRRVILNFCRDTEPGGIKKKTNYHRRNQGSPNKKSGVLPVFTAINHFNNDRIATITLFLPMPFPQGEELKANSILTADRSLNIRATAVSSFIQHPPVTLPRLSSRAPVVRRTRSCQNTSAKGKTLQELRTLP